MLRMVPRCISLAVALGFISPMARAAATPDGPIPATPPVVILKLDDVFPSGEAGGPVSPRWKRVADYLEKGGLKSSFGIICSSLEVDNPAYFDWIKDHQKKGLVEFWLHGYRQRKATDPTGEFEQGTWEEQKAALARSEALSQQTLGFSLPAFGPHWSGTTDETDRALAAIPEVKIWLYGPKAPRFFKGLSLEHVMAIEDPTFVPDFEKFRASYEKRGKQQRVLVLQGHPDMWNESRWEGFVKIVAFLKSQGCSFTTPSEYLKSSAGPAAAPADASPRRPNIVILLCDDLGYGDLGCFANPVIQTPNLDRLAAEGVRLTHCYSSSPVCSPSRAGLLTGRNPNRLGIRDWIPENSGIFLRPGEVTIAQLLKQAGYRTLHAGKWHLNSRTDGSERTPGAAGFDHWLYTQNNAAPSHLNPTNFVRNGKPVGPLQGASSEIVVNEAIRFLDESKSNAPFFLNLWFHETHEPVAAQDRFLAMYPDDSNLDRRHYHGDASQMDHNVGRLLKYLDDHGLSGNTFVFFSSDNGPETLNRYATANRSYGSPGPLRGMKLHITEAGYRVPGIVRWPGHTRAGTVCTEPVCHLDLLPTLCEIVGVTPPKDRALDGASLRPLFDGRPIVRPHPLYWQYDFAISKPWEVSLRDGPWKLLANKALNRFELYNLVEDIGEATNLADQYPDRVRDMTAVMKRLHAEINAEGASSGNPKPRL